MSLIKISGVTASPEDYIIFFRFIEKYGMDMFLEYYSDYQKLSLERLQQRHKKVIEMCLENNFSLESNFNDVDKRSTGLGYNVKDCLENLALFQEKEIDYLTLGTANILDPNMSPEERFHMDGSIIKHYTDGEITYYAPDYQNYEYNYRFRMKIINSSWLLCAQNYRGETEDVYSRKILTINSFFEDFSNLPEVTEIERIDQPKTLRLARLNNKIVEQKRR